MANTIYMPKLGVTMEEGNIVEWHCNVGDSVAQGAVLVSIEGDKAVTEYEAPEGGVVLEILAQPGDVVECGKPICIIGAAGEQVGSATVQQDNKAEVVVAEATQAIAAANSAEDFTTGKVKAVPLVRKLAAQNGVNLAELKGSGPAGRISKADVLAYVAQPKIQQAALAIDISQTVGSKEAGDRKIVRTVPLQGMRGAIAKSMTKSIVEGPQGTQFKEIDATELLKLQEVIGPAIKEQTGSNLSVTAILVKACAKALQEHPDLNTIIEDNQIKYIENVNIGIAVAVEGGLLVPVLHNAQDLSLAQIVIKLKELAVKAREGRLKPADMAGGTFTITNLGMFNTGFFTPLINPPESAIIGIGSITNKPYVCGEQIEIRPLLPLSITIDHRSVDGAPAAQFMSSLEKMLGTPWQKRITDICF